MSGITTTASNKPIKDQDIENQNIWLSDLMKEYSELLDELTYDNSPNSRQKKADLIWNNEQKNPPLIKRQHNTQIFPVEL
jgi:hypothetical protein